MTKREKRKLVLIATMAFILVVMLFACGNKVDFREETYVVGRGETLWSIYSENCNDVEWALWLHETLAVNGIGNNHTLMPGDEIILLIAEQE